jgi:hypothetical protein
MQSVRIATYLPNTAQSLPFLRPVATLSTHAPRSMNAARMGMAVPPLRRPPCRAQIPQRNSCSRGLEIGDHLLESRGISAPAVGERRVMCFALSRPRVYPNCGRCCRAAAVRCDGPCSSFERHLFCSRTKTCQTKQRSASAACFVLRSLRAEMITENADQFKLSSLHTSRRPLSAAGSRG